MNNRTGILLGGVIAGRVPVAELIESEAGQEQGLGVMVKLANLRIIEMADNPDEGLERRTDSQLAVYYY